MYALVEKWKMEKRQTQIPYQPQTKSFINYNYDELLWMIYFMRMFLLFLEIVNCIVGIAVAISFRIKSMQWINKMDNSSNDNQIWPSMVWDLLLIEKGKNHKTFQFDGRISKNNEGRGKCKVWKIQSTKTKSVAKWLKNIKVFMCSSVSIGFFSYTFSIIIIVIISLWVVLIFIGYLYDGRTVRLLKLRHFHKFAPGRWSGT